jgi:DNA-binding NtrC family response regulator
MGGVREQNVDVRLVAATHHDLLAAVENKTFRADLFYRISTVTLHVPALRQRVGDLPILVQHLLAEERCPQVTLSREAWAKLEGSSWPGNIRELKNVLHRALILRHGDVIGPDAIRFDSDARASSAMLAAAPSSVPSVRALGEAVGPERRTLDEVEREHIERALAAENGRVRDAAIRLGIPRSTLYQKIKNYGIRLTTRARPATPLSDVPDVPDVPDE